MMNARFLGLALAIVVAVLPNLGNADSTELSFPSRPSEMMETPALAGDPISAEPADQSGTTPPVVRRLEFTPKENLAGASVRLVVQIEDSGNGVKEVVGIIEGPSSRSRIGVSLREDEPGFWSADIPIPAFAENGAWRLASLHLVDHANNHVPWRAPDRTLPDQWQFSVRSEFADGIPPSVNGLILEQSTIEAGLKNFISVEVVDAGTGVSRLTGVFSNVDTGVMLSFSCAWFEGDLWKGVVSIPEEAGCGEWVLVQVDAEDAAGNLNTSTLKNLSRHSFMVTNSRGCEKTAIEIQSIALDYEPFVARTGGAVQIGIRLAGEESRLKSVSGLVRSTKLPWGGFQELPFVLCPGSDAEGALWSGSVSMPPDSARGQWTIPWIRVVYDGGSEVLLAVDALTLQSAAFVLE